MSTATLTASSSGSPKPRHRRPKSIVQSNSELLLSNASTSRGSPETENSPRQEASSSRISYLITPILFISFLVSLILVDNRNRNAIHPPTTDCNKDCDSEDYYHSRQRKIAKMEFMDAFEMRDKILRGFGYGWFWGTEPEQKKVDKREM